MLDQLADAKRRENTATRDQLVLVAQWCDLHPAESIHDAAAYLRQRVEGGEHALAIGGAGCPLVAEFCLTELGAVLSLRTEAARDLAGEVLELRHRLPRCWKRVLSLALPAWRARRIARATLHLAPEAAAFVDAQISHVAHQIGPAATDRLIDDAIARFMPDLAEEQQVQLGGADFGWRLVFYVNAPVGLVLVVLAMRWLPKVERGPSQSLDPVGVLLFASTVVLVLLPVVEGRQGERLAQRPWWLLAVVFWRWERHWDGRGRATLVDLALPRIRSYVFGLGLGTFYFAGFTSIFIILTLYLQNGLRYTALQAGATQVAFAVGSAASAYAAGRVVGRFGRWLAVAGLTMVAAGLIGLDVVVPRIDGDVGLKLAPLLLLAGLGGGLVISPNITLSLDEVDPARAGAGGGLLQTAQRTGSAIGVAVVLAQFFDRVVASHGDYGDAFSAALRTTLGLVLVALVIALVDLTRRAVGGAPRGEDDEPRHLAGSHLV